MAGDNPVPKLYRSIIEDVIEGVRDLFAEEGIEEHVLKDLKQLWETKVLQSRATEDFFGNSIRLPFFTLPLPHTLHQTLQSSTASLVVPASRTLPGCTPAELDTARSGASFAFPGCPIYVPAGVTLQTASGQLYKVNVPIIVTQTSGRPSALQHPVQVLQQLGPPAVIQGSVPQLSPCSLQAAAERSRGVDAVPQQLTVPACGPVGRKNLGNATSDGCAPPGWEHGVRSAALLSENSPCAHGSGAAFPSWAAPAGPSAEPALSAPAAGRRRLLGGSLPAAGPQGTPHHQVALSSQLTDDDINRIIQVDGTGDASSNEEVGNVRDAEENEFLQIIDAGDLKVLEEAADSTSSEDSTASSSDDEGPEVALVDEIHRNKNKWKFYLKDGVMCFGGRDYVFAKAIGDAEW
ncbi:TFIIA-alpha and beta-like factor isoform X2 [Octodon degus]|uniref:TFIIA-alpha and beta-like factor isoform X2 n=1 Tax=Octodon degus TaxID=10160 RepID=A0A6P6E4P6_OCTDE|nr:TFIIA-alpha and beta-like factor isoform X2 [Octodon degus]